MIPSVRTLARGVVRHASGGAVAGLALLCGVLAAGGPARAQTCLEQIVVVQDALKQQGATPRQPAEQAQSVGAQDNRQPTPGSLAAAGMSEPQGGAWGALNEAMNLQASGDEQGCLKALARARELGGVK